MGWKRQGSTAEIKPGWRRAASSACSRIRGGPDCSEHCPQQAAAYAGTFAIQHRTQSYTAADGVGASSSSSTSVVNRRCNLEDYSPGTV